MTSLESLLERVRAATSGDRDIDFAITKAFALEVKPYTRSLDAIVGLIERKLPEFHIRIEPRFFIDGEKVMYRVYLIKPLWGRWNPMDEWFETHEGSMHADRVLACCVAFLEALIAVGKKAPKAEKPRADGHDELLEMDQLYTDRDREG